MDNKEINKPDITSRPETNIKRPTVEDFAIVDAEGKPNSTLLKTYLPDEFKLETVGASASLDLPMAFYLGEMARWLYQEKQRFY